MNLKKASMMMVAFLSLTIPGALWAQSPLGEGGNKNYGILKLGNYLPRSGDLDQLNATNGFAGEVAFGYYLYPNFSLEAAVGYFETKGNANNTDRKFSVNPLEVAGKLGIPLGFVEPYISLGLGAYYVKATAGNLQQTTTRGGAFAGGGVNFNLGKTVFLGVEARYLRLSAPAPSVPVATLYSSSSNNVDVNLSGVILTGNLGFRF